MLEVEVSLEDADEDHAIHVAREHYREGQAAEVPLDENGQWRRKIPLEEFVPDAVSAITELVGANDLLERAGIEVTAVSGRESPEEELSAQETREARLEDAALLELQASGVAEAARLLCPAPDYRLAIYRRMRQAAKRPQPDSAPRLPGCPALGRTAFLLALVKAHLLDARRKRGQHSDIPYEAITWSFEA